MMELLMRSLILAVLLASSPAWSATDLLAAWQAARGHDPVYQGDRASAQAGSHKQKQGQALWLPTVGLQAGGAYANMKNETQGATFSAPGMGTMNNADFTTDVRNGRDTHWGIVATQPIYNAERSASAAQLTQQSYLAELQFRENEQQLALRVVRRYFDVLLAQEALATLQAQKAAVQEALDMARESFRIGKSASTDMHEAQASFDAVVAQEYALASDLDLKRELFSDLTGLPANDLARLGSAVDLDALRPGALPSLIEQGLAESPLVLMSDAGKEISQLEIDKYRALTAATLDLVAQYGRQNLDGSSDSSSVYGRSGSIGLQLTIPLFTGGMRSAKHDEAVALADKARNDAQAARQAVTQRVRAAYLALTTGLEQQRALKQGVVSAQSKLDATRTGQELGARTTADVLNAQQAYYGVRNALTRTHYQILSSALDLAAATGALDEQKLGRVNALLSR
jgi:outer membrane protein